MKLSGNIAAYNEWEIGSIRKVKYPTPWLLPYRLSESPRERSGYPT